MSTKKTSKNKLKPLRKICIDHEKPFFNLKFLQHSMSIFHIKISLSLKQHLKKNSYISNTVFLTLPANTNFSPHSDSVENFVVFAKVVSYAIKMKNKQQNNV